MLRVAKTAGTLSRCRSSILGLTKHAVATVGCQVSQRFRTMKVYTRTGDKGKSSLFTGERREKDDEVFKALGDVDELNSTIGLAREHAAHGGGVNAQDLLPQLEEIQSRLIDVGTAVATPPEKASAAKRELASFAQGSVDKLETWIDEMDEELPPLRNFILPSGGLAAAQLHVARSTCRRAERRVVPLVRRGQVEDSVGRFLNRLSDYLFTAARLASHRAGEPELVYKKVRPAKAGAEEGEEEEAGQAAQADGEQQQQQQQAAAAGSGAADA